MYRALVDIDGLLETYPDHPMREGLLKNQELQTLITQHHQLPFSHVYQAFTAFPDETIAIVESFDYTALEGTLDEIKYAPSRVELRDRITTLACKKAAVRNGNAWLKSLYRDEPSQESPFPHYFATKEEIAGALKLYAGVAEDTPLEQVIPSPKKVATFAGYTAFDAQVAVRFFQHVTEEITEEVGRQINDDSLDDDGFKLLIDMTADRCGEAKMRLGNCLRLKLFGHLICSQGGKAAEAIDTHFRKVIDAMSLYHDQTAMLTRTIEKIARQQ
ncbi:MAG: hypothetical protein HQL50_03890 [Magnetococcales bacterium]|nr:hypothetical protein [Magnetococcales bacterium]